MKVVFPTALVLLRKNNPALLLAILCLHCLMYNKANSGQIYYEGKNAETIIESGELQEKIKEDDHTHLVLEYKNNLFWCTVENNGNKTCTEY